MTVTRVTSGGLAPGIEIRLKSANTPADVALSFEDSGGTGIYSTEQHGFGIATQGVKRLEVDPSGNITGTFKSVSVNILSTGNTGTWNLGLIPSTTIPGVNAYEPIKIDSQLSYNASTDTLSLPNISLSGSLTAGSISTSGDLSAGNTTITGNLTVSGNITGTVNTTVANATNSTNANFLNVGTTSTNADFPIAMWGLEVGSLKSGRQNANLSYNPVTDIVRIGNLRLASYIPTSSNIGNLYIAPDSPGQARIQLYNGGTTAEWIFGQKSSSNHDFILSKSVAGSETDYFRISTSGTVSIPLTLNVEGHIEIDGTEVISSDRRLTNVNSVWKLITVTATGKTLENREFCTVTGAGQTITLPASPQVGWEVAIAVDNFSDTTVARNGQNIMGLAEDITLDLPYAVMQFIYVGSTQGWRLY